MKSKLCIGSLGIMWLFTLISCAQDKTSGSSVSFDELQRNFANPSIEYSTVPWWVWNDKVTKGKIEAQLQYFKDNDKYVSLYIKLQNLKQKLEKATLIT
jgi:hypothetical protein